LEGDFPHPSRPALGSTQLPVHWVPGLSRGKAAGAWRWPPISHIAPRLKKEYSYNFTPHLGHRGLCFWASARFCLLFGSLQSRQFMDMM